MAERDRGMGEFADARDYPRPVIGITGSIGAGKSTVAKILADLGCVVCHSDQLGRAALEDPMVREILLSWWGTAILDHTGAIDRGRVAAIVFADPAERRRLEGLTHPWIEARRRALFADAPPETPALVIDAPLLIEAGLDRACDAVIFVDAPRDVRLERVRRSRDWDDAELARREDSQLPLDAKRSRADHVVRNDGTPDDLVARVRTILTDIVESRRA